MSSPFLPITTPGRAEKIVMRAFLAGRSIRMRDTAAFFRRAFRNSRTFRSSASIVAKFLFDAYQRDAQLRVTGSRKPGRVNLLSHGLLSVRQLPTVM